MVSVGRWSERGGESVPAVVCVSVSVVSVGSMSVDVLYRVSYRVGVVMVVCRLFSMSRSVNGWPSCMLNKLMLMSPWMVMCVLGLVVRMESIAFCRFLLKSGMGRGRL